MTERAYGSSPWEADGMSTPPPLERVSMDTLATHTNASHDLTPVNGEVMAFVSVDHELRCTDTIVEIDNNGDTTEVFHGGDHLSTCHFNALRYNETEARYTISDHRATVLLSLFPTTESCFALLGKSNNCTNIQNQPA